MTTPGPTVQTGQSARTAAAGHPHRATRPALEGTVCLAEGSRGANPAAVGDAGKPAPLHGRVSPGRKRGHSKSVTGRDPEFIDRVAARLALGAFLMAAFWISRTYNPVLYLLMGLPLAHQIAYSAGSADQLLTPRQRWRDSWIILGLCLSSIVLIWLMAVRLKG